MFKMHHSKFLSMFLVLVLAMAALSFASGPEQETEPAEMFYYVAHKVRLETYDDNNLARTQDLGTEELWVGKREIAEVSGGRLTYLNTEKNQLILIDHSILFFLYLDTCFHRYDRESNKKTK